MIGIVSIDILSCGDLHFFPAAYFRILFLYQFLNKWWMGASESYLSDACAYRS